MNVIQWIRLALLVYSQIAPETRTTADDKIISELTAALDEMEKVHGTELTKVQLDSLRTRKLWPTPPAQS